MPTWNATPIHRVAFRVTGINTRNGNDSSQINVTNARRLRVAWRHEQAVDWRERLKGWRSEGPEAWLRRLWYPHPRVWGREKQVSSPLVIESHRQIVENKKLFHSRELQTLNVYFQLILLEGGKVEGI